MAPKKREPNQVTDLSEQSVAPAPAVTGVGSTKRRKFRIPGEDAPAVVKVDTVVPQPPAACFARLFGGRSSACPQETVLDVEDTPPRTLPSSSSTAPAAQTSCQASPPSATAPEAGGQSVSAKRSFSVRLGGDLTQPSNTSPAHASAAAHPPVVQVSTSTAQPQPPTQAPVGKPGLVLDGVTMAFTGEFDTMTRVDAEEKAKVAGAKVVGSVSGNTKYLVVGSHLDDGRRVEETSKYRKYLELKEKAQTAKGKGKHPELLDEQQFRAIVGESDREKTKTGLAQPTETPSVQPQKLKATSVAELASWVDLHAPRDFGQLVGNASIIKKISEWLRDWDDVVLRGNAKKVPFKPGGGMPDNVNARAILVSGPPGIGKTTTCRLVAQLHGAYEVLEYNASDARGQKVIQDMASGIADNTTISFGGLANKKMPSLTKRAVIIMDEVDGMGAGDRGGNAALIKMIKKTKNPIMCICNDEGAQKIRSLSYSCYHIKFSRPPRNIVAQRCAQIAKEQGLEVEPNALEALAESCGSDMRMVLNQLQMLARSPVYKSVGIKYTDMRERLNELSKDHGIMLTPFDACKKLLNSSEAQRLSFKDKLEMFFVDHSLVGLLVQENMYRAVEKKTVDAALLQRCAYSADLMTVGDIMNRKLSSNQDWSLLPHVGIATAVYPTQITNGFIAFPNFPSFLGKYSTMTRTMRLATELQAHLRFGATVKRRSMITSGYTDLLYRRAVGPLLVNDGTCSVDASVAVLDAYGLRREHLAEHLSELRQHMGGDDLFKLVDAKVKAAVTRELNTGGHAVKVMLPGGKKRKAEPSLEELGEDADERADDNANAPQDEKSDDEGAGGLLKVKNKAKAKGKAKSKANAKDDESGSPAAPKAKGRAKAKARRGATTDF